MSVQRIINALGPDCPSTYPLVIPILQHCLDQAQVTQLIIKLLEFRPVFERMTPTYEQPLNADGG